MSQASRRAPLQATLNEWVNPEAVGAYADHMDANAEHIAGYQWPDDPSGAHAEAITALRVAAGEIRAAVASAVKARALADDIHYARIYGR